MLPMDIFIIFSLIIGMLLLAYNVISINHHSVIDPYDRYRERVPSCAEFQRMTKEEVIAWTRGK